jgi:hypothetical protein
VTDLQPNFTATFSVNQTPKEAFDAIANVRGWWSENITGRTDKVGEEWTYRYQDLHRCTLQVTEVIPNKKIAWRVLDNYFSFTKDKREWKGTTLVFELSRKGDKTEVHFSHEGLTPEYECFGVCSNAWGTYINGSLKRLITTGKGSPNEKE